MCEKSWSTPWSSMLSLDISQFPSVNLCIKEGCVKNAPNCDIYKLRNCADVRSHTDNWEILQSKSLTACTWRIDIKLSSYFNFSWSILVIINRFWNTNQISQVTNKDCLTNHAWSWDNVSFKFPHRHHCRCLLFGKDANVIMCRLLSFNIQTVASSTTGANMNYHFIWKYLCSSCWWTNNPYIHGFAFFSPVVKVHTLQLWRYLFIA